MSECTDLEFHNDHINEEKHIDYQKRDLISFYLIEKNEMNVHSEVLFHKKLFKRIVRKYFMYYLLRNFRIESLCYKTYRIFEINIRI